MFHVSTPDLLGRVPLPLITCHLSFYHLLSFFWACGLHPQAAGLSPIPSLLCSLSRLVAVALGWEVFTVNCLSCLLCEPYAWQSLSSLIVFNLIMVIPLSQERKIIAELTLALLTFPLILLSFLSFSFPALWCPLTPHLGSLAYFPSALPCDLPPLPSSALPRNLELRPWDTAQTSRPCQAVELAAKLAVWKAFWLAVNARRMNQLDT